MHDTLTERLVRGVGTFFFPDVALSLRQIASNPRGDLCASSLMASWRPDSTSPIPAPASSTVSVRLMPNLSTACSTPRMKWRIASSVRGSTPVVNTGASAVGK
jgi:hypothetical protein